MKKPLHDIQKAFFNDMAKGQESTTTNGHFNVYQKAYRIRIREGITEDFSESLGGISEELTDQLFAEFFDKCSSESFTLNSMGFVWMDFLNATSLPLPKWFKELSHFEWSLTLALYKESDSQFTPREILLATSDDGTPDDTLPKVRLAPAVTLLQYDFPVAQIYNADDKKSYVTELANTEEMSSKHKLVCWRHDGESNFSSISDFSFEILQQFLAGKNLVEISNDLIVDDTVANERLAQQIQEAFAELSSLGILAIA